jgi:uncharacterized protein YbcI
LFSKSYVQRKVLMLTDEEIAEIEKDLAKEEPFITQDQEHQIMMSQPSEDDSNANSETGE